MSAVLEAVTQIAPDAEPRWRWRSFLRHRVGTVGAAMLLFAVVVAVFAPWIAPYDPYAPVQITIDDIFQDPSPAHLLGTDDGGKDLLSALIYGTRVSLVVGFTGGRDRDLHRRRGRDRGRVPARLARLAPHAHHRLVPGHPRPGPDDRARRDHRTLAAHDHHRHRHPRLDGHGASRPGADPVGARAQVRRCERGRSVPATCTSCATTSCRRSCR